MPTAHTKAMRFKRARDRCMATRDLIQSEIMAKRHRATDYTAQEQRSIEAYLQAREKKERGRAK
jgi:hypothetical protein